MDGTGSELREWAEASAKREGLYETVYQLLLEAAYRSTYGPPALVDLGLELGLHDAWQRVKAARKEAA